MHCCIKTSIDGSIFYLYYLYCLSIFQRTCRFRFKSGCKGKRFIFNRQTFSEVFFSFFLFTHFSGSLCERERMYKRKETKDAFFTNRTAKIRTLFYIFQNFFEVFFVLMLKTKTRFLTKSILQGFLLLESGCKSRPFLHILQIYQDLFSKFF